MTRMVDVDCLKLTTYFGERDRTEHQLLADALLDLYGRHQVQTSILLRGISGFGLKHHLHTEQLLTLSEDLPLVSVAVDERPRIERLLADVMAIKRRGLLTLERARLLSCELNSGQLSQTADQAIKLTIYVGREERANGRPAFQAVCDLLHASGISGASVLLGVDGTNHGERARAHFLRSSPDVPTMIIAVGGGAEISAVVPRLGALLQRPMITVERVRICKRDGRLLAVPHELSGSDEHGLAIWQKLMIHTSESAQHDGRPLHRELVARLRAADVAGATTLRGIWGFHGDHAPHGDRLLQLRRHVPVVAIVVDTPPRIAAAFPIIDELTSHGGLVTSELVPALAAMAGGGPTGGMQLATPTS
jgi:PII-like signaling protein